MTATSWKLDKDLCRCCHGEGDGGTSTLFSLSDPVYNLGVTEVYLDMLKSCLDIELTPVIKTTMAMKICSHCVHRLRDASSFKRQVQRCEERFKEMYQQLLQVVNPEVKQEQTAINVDVKQELEENSADDGFDMKFEDSDDDQPIIKIKVEDSRKSNRRTKTKTVAKSKRGRPVRKRKAQTTQAAEEGEGDHTDAGDIAERKKDNDLAMQSCVVTEVEGARLYQCKSCHKEFKKKSHFLSHHKHAHLKFGAHFTLTKAEDGSNDYLYNCNSCGKQWRKFMYFRQHYKNVHEKVLAGRCDLCNIKLHSVKKAKHMEEVHGVPQPMCNICNKKFAFPSMVLRHQKIIHMGEANFECPTCQKRFPTLDRWKRHQIVHSTVREDTCTHCGKSFKWKKSLQAHMRIHLEDRRYVCKVCGEAFVHGTSLRYHRNKKHPNVHNLPP